jgi:hypothetical protein
MPLVDPVIERVLAEFERRAEEEQRRISAPGTNLDDLLLPIGREAGILLYLLRPRTWHISSWVRLWILRVARRRGASGGKIKS